MVGNSNSGKYDDGDYKHDCPRPMTGCDFPNCSCDVDANELSHKEMQQINEAQDVVDKARGLVNDE